MLRICVFYAIIFRPSFFFQKLAYEYAKSVFIHSVVLKCERIVSVELFLHFLYCFLLRHTRNVNQSNLRHDNYANSMLIYLHAQTPYIRLFHFFGHITNVDPIQLQMI